MGVLDPVSDLGERVHRTKGASKRPSKRTLWQTLEGVNLSLKAFKVFHFSMK